MIKRTIIALLSVLAFTSNTIAQERSHFEEEVAIGVQGGLNLAQVRFLHNDVSYANNLGDLGWRSGATAGASVRFIAQKHFGIQLEANYLQNGWKEKWKDDEKIGDISFADASTERTINYLSVPVLAHIYFGNTNRLFFNLGPKLAVMVGKGKNKNNLNEEQKQLILSNNSEDPRLNDKIEPRNMDYGLCAGFGYELHLNKFSILAEFRYTYGLQDVFDHSRSATFQRSNNQDIQFTLGVMLPVLKFHSN